MEKQVERRRSPRPRTYLGAQIVFDDRKCVVDCLVRNLTEEGGLLSLGAGILIPENFELSVQKTGETKTAHITWRKDTLIGVTFERAEDKLVSLDAARQIRRLEAERDALSRRVAQLSQD